MGFFPLRCSLSRTKASNFFRYSSSASKYSLRSRRRWFSAIISSSTDFSNGCFLGLPVLFLPRRSVMKPAAPSSKYMRSHRRSRERNLEQSVFVSTPQYFLTVSLYVIWFSRISIITAILNSGEYFVLNFFPLDMKICTSKSLSNFWGAYQNPRRASLCPLAPERLFRFAERRSILC